MRKIFSCFISVAILLICVSSVYAQKTLFAKIIHYQGKVLVKENDSSSWNKARVDMELLAGASIKTQKGSSCDLSISGDLKQIVSLDENTEVLIGDLSAAKINMQRGRVFAIMENLPEGSTFEVQTPVAVAGMRGSGMVVEDNGKGTYVEGHQGSIFTYGLDINGSRFGYQDIPPGYGCLVALFSQPGALELLKQLMLDRWIRWKDKLIEHIKYFIRKHPQETELTQQLEDLLDKLEEHRQGTTEFFDIDKIKDRKERYPNINYK